MSVKKSMALEPVNSGFFRYASISKSYIWVEDLHQNSSAGPFYPIYYTSGRYLIPIKIEKPRLRSHLRQLLYTNFHDHDHDTLVTIHKPSCSRGQLACVHVDSLDFSLIFTCLSTFHSAMAGCWLAGAWHGVRLGWFLLAAS